MCIFQKFLAPFPSIYLNSARKGIGDRVRVRIVTDLSLILSGRQTCAQKAHCFKLIINGKFV